MKTKAIGYGMGKKDFEAANCVRAFLGDTPQEREQAVELRCNLDDITAEELAFAQELLLERGALSDDTLAALISARKIFPCCFGSALKNEGVAEFLQLLTRFTREPARGADFGARVFKISRDAQGTRLTHLKVTGGTLRAKTQLPCGKADQLRLYSGAKFRPLDEAGAGEVVAVTGLADTYPGQGLGAEADGEKPVLQSVLTYRILLPDGTDAHTVLPKLRELEDEDPMLRIVWEEASGELHAELMGEARVIACTLVGSSHRLLEGMKFGTLFIDEAAQALEAACWIPMRRAGRVVLAGAHCQLPPTVKSIAAMRAGLGKTLMERIAENKPEVVTLLKIQYRMNEEIMRFSSDWFYHGKVQSAPQIKYRSILDYDHAITWIDTGDTENQITIEGEEASEDSASSSSSADHNTVSASVARQNVDMNFKEQFVGESFGRINKAEAELTLLTLAEYFTKIGKQRVIDERIDVGIISPYRAQVQYLKRLIKKYEFFKPYRRLISVNTVDGFQGQERDVILISLVRSNDEGQIGFLKDLRRMNVAMTRARMKLIILGNKDTMTQHLFYKQLWEYVEALQGKEE